MTNTGMSSNKTETNNLIISEARADARWGLGYTVTPDGEAWPILIDGRQTGSQGLWIGNDVKKHLAPHEGTGALPSAYRVIRCEATTHAGKPCKVKPINGLEFCRIHESHDELLWKIKNSPCVSALQQTWIEHQVECAANGFYLKAYRVRGKWLEREGLNW